MSFFEPKKRYQPLFVAGKEPQLIGIFKVDHSYLDLPRIMHQHDNRCELLFVVEGTAKHIIDGQRYELSPGYLAIYNAGILHEEYLDASDDMVVYSLGIANLNIEGLPPNHLLDPKVRPVIDTDNSSHFFVSLLDKIYEQTVLNTDKGTSVAHYFLLALISLIHAEQKVVNPVDDELTNTGIAIKRWLDLHYQEDITLQDISEALFLSQYHISRAFKRFSGYSPTQYIARRRIGEAQSLLIHTQMPILDIALRVGYNSNSLFSRTFKTIVGRTPVQYRKDMQK